MSEQRHTETPLLVSDGLLLRNAEGEVVGLLRHDQDADRIVTAVNAHEAMKEALEEAEEFLRNGTPIHDGSVVHHSIRAALRLARGEA